MTTAPTNEMLALADELHETAQWAGGDLESVLLRAEKALRLSATTSARGVRLDREQVARALHALDCADADEEMRRGKLPVPEKWADPWLPSSIRQLEKLRRRADAFIISLSNLDAAAPAAGGDAEPVAWQRRLKAVDKPWSSWLTCSPEQAKYALEHGHPEDYAMLRAQARPLYAAPPLQAPSHSDAVREALRDFITEMDRSSERPSFALYQRAKAALTAPAAKATDDRACTCHPDDNPPQSCQRQFAYSECVNAAQSGDDGLLTGAYPQPIEHYRREAKNLAALWSDGNGGAETAILASLLRAAKSPAVSEADVVKIMSDWIYYDSGAKKIRGEARAATEILALIQSAAQGGRTEGGEDLGDALERHGFCIGRPSVHAKLRNALAATPEEISADKTLICSSPSDPPSQEGSAPPIAGGR